MLWALVMLLQPHFTEGVQSSTVTYMTTYFKEDKYKNNHKAQQQRMTAKKYWILMYIAHPI